jgi:hypothetical protein
MLTYDIFYIFISISKSWINYLKICMFYKCI